MKFKTLKHKTLEDTFGCMMEVADQNNIGIRQWEIAHTSIPVLQPMTATLGMVIEYWGKQERAGRMMNYLMDYEMVVVDVKLVFESESI